MFLLSGVGPASRVYTASLPGLRTFSTSQAKERSWQAGANLVKIVAPASFALAAISYSTSSKSLHAEGGQGKSLSGWKVREVDTSAPRISSTHLVFMSHEDEHRDAWQGWIGYFRVAGYNCVDLNIKVEGQADDGQLSEELGDKVRLLSLQRPPVLFAYSGQGARLALEHIQSSRPKIGGLVLVVPQGTDLESVEKADKLEKNKLNILLLDNKEDREAIRTTERWLDSQGFS